MIKRVELPAYPFAHLQITWTSAQRYELTGDDLSHRDTYEIEIDPKLSLRYRDYMLYLFERMLYTEMLYLYDRQYRFEVPRWYRTWS